MTTVLVAGFFVGIMYGLLAVGLVLIYRATRVLNFAYGEIGMIAAFVCNELWTEQRLGLAAALPIALLVAATLGAVTEVVLVRPLRNAERIRATVGTFAIGMLLVIFAGRRWGLYPQFSPPLIAGSELHLGGVNIRRDQLLILALAVVVLLAIALVYRHTSLGLRLKATALDPYAAGLVGININRTSMFTWAVASALAGVCAILVGSTGSLDVSFMTLFALRAVAAALVGGLTSISGAFGAGILLGLVEAVIAFETPVAGINEVLLAVFILVLLIFRPRGLVRSAY